MANEIQQYRRKAGKPFWGVLYVEHGLHVCLQEIDKQRSLREIAKKANATGG